MYCKKLTFWVYPIKIKKNSAETTKILKKGLMLFNFFPKGFDFYDLFEKQVSFAVDAVTCFKKMVLSGVVDDASCMKIQDIEHQADEAAHAIFEQLNKTFITPFDREDIHSLTGELDDVVDIFDTIVGRMKVYKISGVNKNLVEFSYVLEKSILAVMRAVKGLRNTKHLDEVMTACVEINSFENVGDSMRDNILAELFETEKDPIAVIKWKEIYEDAETVLDICEDIAHVVQTILVKQA